MDSSRLRSGEIVAGIGGVALFVFLFFDWFGTPGGFAGGSLDGWDGLGSDFSGFIVALTSVSGAALAVLAMAGQRVNIPLPRGAVTAMLGSLSVAIILWRFFANPGDLKIGIFLGLAAAVAIAAGAIEALSQDGVKALVTVPGGRTRTAAASAPPATPSPATAATPARSSSSGGSATRKRSTTKRSTTKRSTTKRSTTRKSSSRSGAGRGGARSGAKRSSGSRASSSRASSSRSRSSSSKGSSKGRSSSRSSGSRSGGSKRSSSRKK